MKKYYYSIVFSFFFIGATAQTVVMSEQVDSSYSKPIYGKNYLHFFHPYLSFGFVFDGMTPDAVVTRFAATNTYNFGIRYKLRITNYLAWGNDFEFNFSRIAYPVYGAEVKNKLYYSNFRLAPFFRFNFGMRGNSIGKFVDLGVWSNFLLSSSEYHEHELSYEWYETIVTEHKHLKYVEPINYGFFVRFGLNNFVLFGEYRYSDFEKISTPTYWRGVPKWTVGLQIGIH